MTSQQSLSHAKGSNTLSVSEAHAFLMRDAAILIDVAIAHFHSLNKTPAWVAPYIPSLVDRGVTIEEVSIFMGIPVRNLRPVAREAGAPEIWLASKVIRERAVEARSMAKNGKSITEIANAFSVSPSVIHSDLTLFGESILDLKDPDPYKLAEHAANGKTVLDVVEITGLSEGTVRHRANKLGVTFRTNFKYQDHGNPESYRRGCRCDQCRKANLDQANKLIRNRVDKTPPESVHGTANGYANWRCKCERCSEAKRVDNRNYYLSRNAGKRKEMRRWTPEEEQILLSSSKSLPELAKELDRTPGALSRKRGLLRERILG